jgi:YVTN family beta-propeller protein
VLLAVAGTVVGVAAPGSGGGSTVLGENAVGIFNPANGHLTARLSVQNDPSAATSGLGAVWVANTNSDSVSRIDAATHQIATVAVGHAPSAIVTGFDSVWVTDSGDSTVARLDPTNPANPQYINVGADPGGIAVGDGSVWVTDTGDGTVDRIDPSKNAVVQTIDVGDNPTGVVVAGKDVWVADAGSNAVSRISGNGNRFTAVATIPVGNDPESLAVAGGELWVTNNLSGTLSRISLAGASSVAGTLTVGSYPTRLAVVGDRLWVASQGDEQVQEIEPGDTPRVVRSIPLGVIPGGITASGGRLWVSGTVDPALHRGGTLTMTGPDPGPADPIGGGDPATFLLTSVYDGLVTYRHVTGADSEAVVPDLATAIPAPTDNGLTYTFQLRSGIRFSNGKLVTVDDVKRGIERAMTAQGVLNQVIRGARHCAPASCDISGIAVDPMSRTVTISLTHPFSGFLAELAALIYAVPANTPLALQSKPILGTGPYRISRYDEHHIVVLTRNPYFRVWSSAAQPEGFPDRIVYHVEGGSTNPVRQARRAVSDVAAGRSDWADARFAGEPLGELQATFGDRLIATPQLATHGIFLNTRVAPFDSLLARRAVALAIDRGAVAADWPTPATVTCQVLPPDYPGYRPYCPFTLRRSTTGTWSEPATSRAQQMVRRSGTENAHVTVWSLPAQAKTMADVVQAMDAIGYRARLKVITNPYLNYFALVSDSRNRAQAGFFGYLGPTVDPSSYFAGIWRCHDFIKNNPANFNAAEFCSPALDRLVARGIALSTTSSTAADQLWAAVDRKLVDSAAYIPLVDTSLLDVISTRVHNYQNNPVIGVLYDQMWVR